MIVPDLVRYHASESTERTAIVSGECRITYGELDAAIDRFANGLIDLGVNKGDRVALLLGNDTAIETVTSYLAVHRAGAINVPLNVRLARPEIAEILDHAGAQYVVATGDITDSHSDLWPTVDTLERVVVIGDTRYADAVAFQDCQGAAEPTGVAVSSDDWADFIYTSGTTGKPKGTIHTHGSALHVGVYAFPLKLRADSVYQTPIPFYTSSGCHTYLMPALFAGCTMVMDPAFQAESTLATIERERTTTFFGVPAMFIYLLSSGAVEKYDRSSLEQIFYGGSIMPFDTIKQIRSVFPKVALGNLYGLTEAGPGGTMLEDRYALTKVGSVGKAIPPFTEVTVIDESGAPVGPNVVGEIAVKGPSAMVGYYRAPELTEQTLRDGWVHTGDLGRTDEEGFLYIVDRKKDMIIRGGFNVYPAEVEAVLQQHPAVLEVAVVGVPHPSLGEDVAAFVIRRADADVDAEELAAFCVDKLADFKRPRHYQFLPVLPRNAMGKVLKRNLRSGS
jgi:acyl-CoA synthetase (AMP-forming)/AMP-acid ligase II